MHETRMVRAKWFSWSFWERAGRGEGVTLRTYTDKSSAQFTALITSL
ncbi:hypothetical protein [Streptomyces sp. CA-106110]